VKGRLKRPSPFRNYNHFSPGRADIGSPRGTLVPLFNIPSPSPLKERGTQGVRLIDNLYLKGYSRKGVSGIIKL